MLIVAAFSLALMHVALQTSAKGDVHFGPDHARQLELPARVHDAGQVYSGAVRALIGLEGADADTPRAVFEEVRTRSGVAPRTPEARALVAAIAVALGEDAGAHDELRGLRAHEATRDAPVAEALTRLADELSRLAEGLPARDPAALRDALAHTHASRWLRVRLEARHLANQGRAAQAEAARGEAIAIAKSHVDAHMAQILTRVLLILLGLVLLAASPFIVRALRRRGLAGLTGPTPFDPSATQRVFLGWFVASILTGAFYALVGGALGADRQASITLMALQVLTHGAIGVALIQRYGGAMARTEPLARSLRLDRGAWPGGPLALLLWSIGGLAVAAFITLVGFLANELVFSPPDSTQRVVELLIADASLGTFLMMILAAAVIAPLVEEIIFRGYLYRNLRETLGWLPAAALSGVIFGLVHLDPPFIVPLSALGFALALLYERTGSLMVPVLVHALWNLLQLLSVWVIYHGA